jgi:hypothetical protein
MPTKQKKSIVIMIPPMVTNCTVIMVVPLVILINRHKVHAKRYSLQHATFDIDIIKLNDLLVILFVAIECATIPQII